MKVTGKIMITKKSCNQRLLTLYESLSKTVPISWSIEFNSFNSNYSLGVKFLGKVYIYLLLKYNNTAIKKLSSDRRENNLQILIV